MRNLLLTIQYDGSAFHGWQVQKNSITVQEVFQNAVEKVFGDRLDVIGCSRTDSKVHAKMYCVSLKTEMLIENDNLVLALNTYLPSEIAVVSCKEVPLNFHPRYDCKSKEYIYKIYNGKIRNPFLTKYAYHYRFPIDEKILNRECKSFIGTYDFSAFCSIKADPNDHVRTIYEAEVTREDDLVVFRIVGNGFLYNMVRIMVGTLLFVASGKIKEGEIPEIIETKNRLNAGKTAPPMGLYLNQINYEERSQ